eukprot:361929-Chlamydomonas_euryale.AAC.3
MAHAARGACGIFTPAFRPRPKPMPRTGATTSFYQPHALTCSTALPNSAARAASVTAVPPEAAPAASVDASAAAAAAVGAARRRSSLPPTPAAAIAAHRTAAHGRRGAGERADERLPSALLTGQRGDADAWATAALTVRRSRAGGGCRAPASAARPPAARIVGVATGGRAELGKGVPGTPCCCCCCCSCHCGVWSIAGWMGLLMYATG